MELCLFCGFFLENTSKCIIIYLSRNSTINSYMWLLLESEAYCGHVYNGLSERLAISPSSFISALKFDSSGFSSSIGS